MAPTETEVLTHYLLQPASLDAILTFAAFAERFPPATRDSPSVRALWTDLVAQREKTLDEVRKNIEREVEQGKIMRREVLKARKAEGTVDEDGEVEMERAVRLLAIELVQNNADAFAVVWRFFWCQRREAHARLDHTRARWRGWGTGDGD